MTVNSLEQLIWDAQLLRSILLELGLTKENAVEKQRSKLQRIIALRKFPEIQFKKLKFRGRILGNSLFLQSRLKSVTNWYS